MMTMTISVASSATIDGRVIEWPTESSPSLPGGSTNHRGHSFVRLSVRRILSQKYRRRCEKDCRRDVVAAFLLLAFPLPHLSTMSLFFYPYLSLFPPGPPHSAPTRSCRALFRSLRSQISFFRHRRRYCSRRSGWRIVERLREGKWVQPVPSRTPSPRPCGRSTRPGSRRWRGSAARAPSAIQIPFRKKCVVPFDTRPSSFSLCLLPLSSMVPDFWTEASTWPTSDSNFPLFRFTGSPTILGNVWGRNYFHCPKADVSFFTTMASFYWRDL